MRQLRATGERNRLRIAEPPQQSRRVFLRLKSPPEGGIWGGVRLVNDANGGDNTIGSKPTERKINKLHKRMNNKYSLPKDGGLISESAPRDIIHRYEKIHTKVYENEYEGVQYVADNIVKAIRMYNEIHCSNEVYEESQPFVLGLTTGRTPLGLYRELVKRHHEGQISFRNVSVYSLDEFYPIRSTEQQSRNYRIHEEFLNHIDILPENVHIPDGTVPEDRVSEYCASYDHSVRRIDLMIIGVGEDGQIGFNEPGSYSRSRTRLVQLTYNTRKIQSGAFFGLENTPKMAVTMGIDTIMRANRIILMAWGVFPGGRFRDDHLAFAHPSGQLRSLEDRGQQFVDGRRPDRNRNPAVEQRPHVVGVNEGVAAGPLDLGKDARQRCVLHLHGQRRFGPGVLPGGPDGLEIHRKQQHRRRKNPQHTACRATPHKEKFLHK